MAFGQTWKPGIGGTPGVPPKKKKYSPSFQCLTCGEWSENHSIYEKDDKGEPVLTHRGEGLLPDSICKHFEKRQEEDPGPEQKKPRVQRKRKEAPESEEEIQDVP